MSKTEQDLWRSEYTRYGTPFKLLATALGERLLLVQDDRRGVVDFMTSPTDPLWDSLPNEAVEEAGAAVLGWVKSDDEDDEFNLRVRRDLDAVASGAP